MSAYIRCDATGQAHARVACRARAARFRAGTLPAELIYCAEAFRKETCAMIREDELGVVLHCIGYGASRAGLCCIRPALVLGPSCTLALSVDVSGC